MPVSGQCDKRMRSEHYVRFGLGYGMACSRSQSLIPYLRAVNYAQVGAASRYLRSLHDLTRTEPQKSDHSVNALISLVAQMSPTNTVCTEPNS